MPLSFLSPLCVCSSVLVYFDQQAIHVEEVGDEPEGAMGEVDDSHVVVVS